jgi:5-methylcytosine-specific restriction enzyme subunit McrC
VLTRGLIRNYHGHSSDLPFLRGRLDAYRQATVHFGRFTEFACEYNEFDRDTMDNHLLLAGVKAARRAADNANIRRRAADLERRLADVAPTLPSKRRLLATKVVYGRRNEHYRVAHTWCRALLELGRLEDQDESDVPKVQTFLINMNALFEKFVEWLIARVYPSRVEVQAQRRNRSLITVNGRYRKAIAPDLVVVEANRSAAIDAKYKKYDDWEITPSDVYQLLLYAQCYTGFTDVPTSYLVYPSSRRRSSPIAVELAVPGEGGARKIRVHAVGIALADVVHGLRIGDQEPLQRAVDMLRAELPVVNESPAAR